MEGYYLMLCMIVYSHKSVNIYCCSSVLCKHMAVSLVWFYMNENLSYLLIHQQFAKRVVLKGPNISFPVYS